MFIKSALSKSPQKFFDIADHTVAAQQKWRKGYSEINFRISLPLFFVLPKAAMVCNLCNLLMRLADPRAFTILKGHL